MKRLLAGITALFLMISGCSPSNTPRAITSTPLIATIAPTPEPTLDPTPSPTPMQIPTPLPTPTPTPKPAPTPTPTPEPTRNPAEAISAIKLIQYIYRGDYPEWAVVIENLTNKTIDKVAIDIDTQAGLDNSSHLVWENVDCTPWASTRFLLYDDSVKAVKIIQMIIYYSDGSQLNIPQEIIPKLSPLKSIKTPIIFTSVSSSRPNSAGGVNWTVSFKNVSGKTIKYITFDVSLINAVGDVVSDDITGDSYAAVEFTGPLANGKSITKTFRTICYNSEATYPRLTWAEIMYTDGSDSDVLDAEIFPLLKIKGNK